MFEVYVFIVIGVLFFILACIGIVVNNIDYNREIKFRKKRRKRVKRKDADT